MSISLIIFITPFDPKDSDNPSLTGPDLTFSASDSGPMPCVCCFKADGKTYHVIFIEDTEDDFDEIPALKNAMGASQEILYIKHNRTDTTEEKLLGKLTREEKLLGKLTRLLKEQRELIKKTPPTLQYVGSYSRTGHYLWENIKDIWKACNCGEAEVKNKAAGIIDGYQAEQVVQVCDRLAAYHFLYAFCIKHQLHLPAELGTIGTEYGEYVKGIPNHSRELLELDRLLRDLKHLLDHPSSSVEELYLDAKIRLEEIVKKNS